MKKILLATMAIATLFASCSKEPAIEQTGDNVIVVSLPDNVVDARTVEAQQTTGATITLSTVTVFLLNGDNVSRVEEFDGTDISAKKKRIEQVASGVNKVIVVANIPSTIAATVKALTSGLAIEKYAYTIASQNTGIATVTRMGSGVPTTVGDPTPDGHDYKAVSVELTPLTARFEIGAVKAGTNVTSVSLVGVWINNYYTNGSKATVKLHDKDDAVWATSPATTGAPILALPGSISMTNAYTETTYYNANSASVTLSAGSQVYAYHVFAGANIPHLIMLVKGEYDVADASGNKFFLGYVTFNKFLNSGSPIAAINANTIYKMGVGVEGITINAEDITEKPEMSPFDLGITVTTTPWTVMNVTPNV